MRFWRPAVAIVSLAGTAILGASLVDCAEPTQIVIEVYSDACPGTAAKTKKLNSTGIAVGTPADIESRVPSALRDGCERAPGVGTLTIFPSGEKDAEIAIKVVAGIETTPDLCLPPDFAGCIAHRRILRFKPNETVRAIVRLSLACLNRKCNPGQTCDNGVCKSESDLLEDGGTRDDAATFEAGAVDTGITDPPVDAAADACFGCKGACDQKKCTVDCSATACGTSNLCAPKLPCTVKCATAGGCLDILCQTAEKCSIDCGEAKDSCGKVTCNAKECDVECVGEKSCDKATFSLDASTNARLKCDGPKACNAASASCTSPSCEMYCKPISGSEAACPPDASTPCSGGCTKWNTRQSL